MANNCIYMMHVKGKKESIDEFFTELRDYERVPHFWRVFSAELTDLEECADGTCIAEIIGDCAWSVDCCMLDGFGTYANDCPQGSTSLKKESERLQLEIEVFSEESGLEFQEHYHYAYGKEIANESIECTMYMFDEDEFDADCLEEAFELFLDNIGMANSGLTLSDLHCGDTLTIGGFDNYGNFSF